MWKNNHKNTSIVLASRSPRRVELLKQIGLTCEIYPADIDESQLANESPIQYVLRLAREKAAASVSILPAAYLGYPVLAADTTVAVSELVLGKPVDDDDARNMLRMLSGTTHQVHTGVALYFEGKVDVLLSSTNVEMMTLSAEQIEQYIATGDHRDKAGSYGIQGLAGAWVKKIEGSYTGVMGLPVYETAALLRQHCIVTI
jgi:septum formation protein